MIAYALAKLCYNNVLEFRLSAKSACELGVVTPALEHIIETNSKSVNLPTTLAEIGLSDITDAQLTRVAETLMLSLKI